MKKILIAPIAALLAMSVVHADFVPVLTGTDEVLFPSTSFVSTAGPVSLVSMLGTTVVYTSTNSSSDLGNAGYGLAANGFWDQPQAGTNSPSATITFTFNLNPGQKILSVGGFINYAPGNGTPVIDVLNSSNTVTQSYNLLVTDSISTPGGDNAGVSIGISRSNSDITAFQISGSYIIIGDLVFTTGPSTFSTSGLTPNQQAVLVPINQGINNGSDNANFNVLVAGLSNAFGSQASLGAALDSYSPQKLQAFRNIAFDNFGFTAAQFDDHTASLRYGQGGFDTSGLQVLDPSMPSMMSQIKGRLLAWNPAPAGGGLLSDTTTSMLGGVQAKDSKDMKEITPVTDQNRWSAFISGNVILADISHDADVAYSHYTTGGVTAGADYRLDDNWAVGGLFGYGHTSAVLDDNGSTARVDSYSPGIYATYADHGWYANGLFAYDYNSYGESRAIPVLSSSTHGSTTGNQYDGDLDGGYEFRSGELTFGPTAALLYVHLDINSLTESGAGALDINSQNADSLRSRLGGEMRYNWLWYGGKVIATPHLSASWQHECLDNSRGITSQFDGAGLGSFTVSTTSPDRDAAFVDAGLDTQWNSAFNLFIDHQVQAGQSNFFAQSIEGGAKVSY